MPQEMSDARNNTAEDEVDEWDKRIYSTGCSALTDSEEENAKLTDCYYEKKDWRACQKEAKMEVFKSCWKKQGNYTRTATRDT